MLIARPLAGVLAAFAVASSLVLFARSQPVPERPEIIVVEAITAPPDPCLLWVPAPIPAAPDTLRAELAPECRSRK